MVLGLYVGGSAVWKSFHPFQGWLQSLKSFVTAAGIAVLLMAIGALLPAWARTGWQQASRAPMASCVVWIVIICWIAVNGADYWVVMGISFLASLPAISLWMYGFEHSRSAGEDESDQWDIARTNRTFAVFLLTWWCLYTAIDWWWEGRRPLLHASAEQHRAYLASSPWIDVNVGVALSGGGYRAALMHAGVLEELRARGVPITHLTAVSGGAIIAAFYAVGGDPTSFRDAVGAGRLNLGRAVFSILNLLRLPFPFRVPFTEHELFPWYSFGRVDVQAQLLDRVLFRGRTLRDLPDSPLLQICATDLRSGRAVGITAEGAIIVDTPASSANDLVIEYTRATPEAFRKDPRSERIARLVAASGAFPGFFNAVPLASDDDQPALLLSDGGLSDNLGIDLMLERHHSEQAVWRLDVLVVSDGSQPFEESGPATGAPVVDELTRAVDVVYKGSGWRNVLPRALPPTVFLRPTDFESDPYAASLLGTFKATRTLDATFDKRETEDLFELGRWIVRANWTRLERALNAQL